MTAVACASMHTMQLSWQLVDGYPGVIVVRMHRPHFLLCSFVLCRCIVVAHVAAAGASLEPVDSFNMTPIQVRPG